MTEDTSASSDETSFGDEDTQDNPKITAQVYLPSDSSHPSNASYSMLMNQPISQQVSAQTLRVNPDTGILLQSNFS